MDKGDGAAERVFAVMLKEIKPTGSEIKQTTARVNGLMRLLKSIVPKDVELIVAGSIARGTNLKGSSDIDIFILFDKKLKRDKIVKLGLEYGKKVVQKEKGRYEIKYAEHPYIRLYLDSVGIKADLVPALKIDNIEEMGTTVDRTPLHNEFINSNLSAKQRDDVRVLKHLLKSHSIYGAEVRTNGFSGYLCELLVHHYGSLLNLLKASSKFRLPVVLEPRSRKTSSDPEVAKRFNSRFVVIDPVDKDRNVAAGVSPESLSRFVILSRAFVSNPSPSLFKGHINELRKYGTYQDFLDGTGLDSYLIESRVADKSDDVVFPQLRKMANILAENAERSGFEVHFTMPHVRSGTGHILLLAARKELRTRLIKGPDAFIPGAADNFIKAHRNSDGFIIRDTTVFALDLNRYETMGAFLSKMIKSELIGKSGDVSIKSARIYKNKIPKNVEKEIVEELGRKLLL